MKKKTTSNTSADTPTPNRTSFWKKVALTTCLGFGITFGSVYASNIENQIPTVYHVYVDGERVGTVDDEKTVQSYMDERLNRAQSNHKEVEVTLGEEVTFVPEKVFRPNTNNEQVMSSLDEMLSIKVDAVQIQVGNQVVGYAENEAEAKQAIENLKEQYVSKDVLSQLEEDSNTEKNIETGESTIVDVQLSEKVSYSNEIVTPDEVLTPKEIVQVFKKGTVEEKVHTVEEGEVLGEIASKYDLSTAELLDLNSDLKEDGIISIGQEVNVTDYTSYLDVIVVEEKKEETTIEYETEVKKSDDMYKGKEKVKQEGQDGKTETHYKITKKNGNVQKEEVVEEEVTKEPKKKIVVKGTKVIPSRGTGDFSWPAVGGVITSKQGMRWGSYHKGIDIAGVSDRTIKSTDNGTVTSAGDGSDGYGKKVEISHNNGYKTIYAHLSSITVKSGQTVQKGQKIGVMGTTGHSTGVHLHFEVYKNGNLQNPLDYVR
ncbi:peptidoglycan DD-metalloendopeptidase family protein [Pontibacillus salicampi]|uniref:Peptidoglycan DD-metalloendopeptidase family protein n=1 Tax=Pontibacillus salicampi TaxID=1449801 RepID=A0ABV6LU80_9BACI